MFYNCNNPAVSVVGMEHLRWKGGSFDVKPRHHAALAFRLQGNATLICGGKEYYASAGDVLYLPQGLPYLATYSDTDLLVFHFVTARPDPEPEVYSPGNSEELYKVFLQGYTHWKSKKPGHIAQTLSALYQCLALLSKQEARAQQPQEFIHAVSLLNTRYQEGDLSIKAICAESAVSETFFRRLFHQFYQKTPVEYLTELRLEHARNLIAGGTPIETAALTSGFNDPKYFARVVKKKLNCTPRELKTFGK